MSRLSPLASVSATRTVLETHGLATKKALGQHFLISDGVVARICETAELSCSDTVLEVGPGIGTLTVALLQRAGRVVAVERDADLPAVLAETCADYADRFALIQKDALALTEDDVLGTLASLEDSSAFPTKLVSNLPYAVAATIVLDFFQRFEALESATIMVQSEVADRMAAKPGTKDYGAYTVKLSLYVQPVSRFRVSPGNFFPPPRVDSSVIRLERVHRHDPAGNPLSKAVVDATCIMADAAFANRRKTILNSCKSYFSAQGEQGTKTLEAIPRILENAGVAPGVRGEALGTQDFIKLGKAYSDLA